MVLDFDVGVHDFLVPEAVVALGATTGEVGGREVTGSNFPVDVSARESNQGCDLFNIEHRLGIDDVIDLTAAQGLLIQALPADFDQVSVVFAPVINFSFVPDAVVVNNDRRTWGSVRCGSS